MFSSTVCRFSGRECWNTMPKPLRAILCAGRPAMFSPSKIDFAVGRALDAHDALHGRRFAGAIGSDQAEDFAGAQIEGEILDGGQAAEPLGQAADGEDGSSGDGLIHYERASRDRAAPRKPPGKNRTTSRATAETMKVASSPVGRGIRRRQSGRSRRAPRPARCAVRRAPPRRSRSRRPRRRPLCRPTRCRNRTPATRPKPEKNALTTKAASLCLTMLKPSAPACTGSCPLACSTRPIGDCDSPYRIAAADRHEAERDPVVCAGIDGDDVGNGQADFTAGEIGKHHDEILQHQHGNQRGQAEIRARARAAPAAPARTRRSTEASAPSTMHR